ncbi:MAG TPA: response regulator [Ruminiclostridium sp.]
MSGKNTYKVVVVEDEPKILRNIIQKIENADTLFKVHGSASNGVDAIELINTIKPDVLFTDIRMPIMDGLELIKHIKTEHPNLQIVILSGYNEFEYAQKAIKLGVIDYLLKPVEEDSLKKTLNGIKSKLNLKMNTDERNILYSDINGVTYDTSLPSIFENSRFAIFLICIGNLSNYLDPRSLHKLYSSLWSNITWEDILNDIIKADYKWWVVDEKQPNQKFLVLSVPDTQIDNLASYASLLKQTLSSHIDSYSVNICMSEQLIPYSEIWSAAQNLRMTVDKGLVMGESSVITPASLNKISQLPILLDMAAQNKLSILIQTNNRNILFQELTGLFDKWIQSSYPQRMIEKTLYNLIRHTYSQSASITEMENIHVEYELSEKFAISPNFKSIYKDILCIFDNILLSDKKDSDNTEELVSRIEDYIRLHYSETISLEDVSNKFNFSISYISKIFKKYKGVSFLQYLITFRINKAKQLMESQLKLEIKDISEIVGYTDQHYFSRIFKNVTGKTPSGYRNWIAISKK